MEFIIGAVIIIVLLLVLGVSPILIIFWCHGRCRIVFDSDGIIFYCELDSTAHDEAHKRKISAD